MHSTLGGRSMGSRVCLCRCRTSPSKSFPTRPGRNPRTGFKSHIAHASNYDCLCHTPNCEKRSQPCACAVLCSKGKTLHSHTYARGFPITRFPVDATRAHLTGHVAHVDKTELRRTATDTHRRSRRRRRRCRSSLSSPVFLFCHYNKL